VFEVGLWYENNLGKYQVLAVNGDALAVRYTDGCERILSVDLQARIQARLKARDGELSPSGLPRRVRSYKWVAGRAYLTMGFFSIRCSRLGANLTADKAQEFKDEYFSIKGAALSDDQDGISFLRDGANQWGNQGVMRFHARETELALLSFSRQGNVPYPVSGADDLWEVKDIGFLFFLLGHGFELGGKQAKDVITSKIPQMQRGFFDKGVEHGSRTG